MDPAPRNVLVRAGERSLEPLLRALTQDAVELGQELLSEAEGECQRTVLLYGPDEAGWVALYDDAQANPEALAALASRCLESWALAAQVRKGVALHLALYSSGELVDPVLLAPPRYGRIPESERRRERGHPKRWAPVLLPASQERLAALFEPEGPGPEARLAQLSSLLGCRKERLLCDAHLARSLPEEPVARLRFRVPAGAPRAKGPVRLRGAGAHVAEPLERCVDDVVRLHFTAYNAGGAGTGLDLVAWGPALDQGLLELQRVELLVGPLGPENKHRFLELQSRTGSHGEVVASVSLTDLALPAGFDGAALSKHLERHPGVYALFDAQVHANVVGRALREGSAELHLAFAPREDRQAGAARAHYEVTVVAPFERPLRFFNPSEQSADSHLLRPLQGARYLNLLASFDAPGAELAPLARELLAGVTALFGDEGRVQTATYAPEPRARPRTGRGKASAMLRPQRLDPLFAAMATAASVELRAQLEERTPPALLWYLGVGSSILGDRTAERLHAVAVSCDTERLGEERSLALRDAWCALLEGPFARSGVQAVVYRAEGQLHHPSGNTPYECATGAAEGMSTVRTWAQRWLRLPGNDRLWLGPTLAARLEAPEREALASLGTLRPCGEGLAFALRERSLVPALEGALAALLATSEQAQAAVRQWYGIAP